MEVESMRASYWQNDERKVRQAPDWSESRHVNAGMSERKRGAMGRTEWSRMKLEDKKDWPGGVKDR